MFLSQVLLNSLQSSQKNTPTNPLQYDLCQRCFIQMVGILSPPLTHCSCLLLWVGCNCVFFFFSTVYADGSICLDILQNRWSPTYDVSSILTSIQVSDQILLFFSQSETFDDMSEQTDEPFVNFSICRLVLSPCSMNQIPTVQPTVRRLSSTRRTSGSMRSACLPSQNKAGEIVDLAILIAALSIVKLCVLQSFSGEPLNFCPRPSPFLILSFYALYLQLPLIECCFFFSCPPRGIYFLYSTPLFQPIRGFVLNLAFMFCQYGRVGSYPKSLVCSNFL